MASPLSSMTGFARSEGTADGLAWAWELRSVNGRGLDLRVRLPSGFDALEPVLREAAGKRLKRGNVTANLTVKREEQAKLAADPAALEQVLALAIELAKRIPGSEPPRAEALLALPGVLRPATAVEDEAVVRTQTEYVRVGFISALNGLVEARRAEGARLAATLAGQVREISDMRTEAAAEATDQPALQRARMIEAVQALPGGNPCPLPAERIAQEVALLASKSDVREELDRLDAHLHAARALLVCGRKTLARRFDFLVQEFNREANTLCSKSASVRTHRHRPEVEGRRSSSCAKQVQNIE